MTRARVTGRLNVSVRKEMKTITSTIILLLLVGCDNTLTGYSFMVHAIYQAPLTNLEIAIDAHGRVIAGDDLSSDHNATVTLTPLSSSGAKVHLTFTDYSQVEYAIGTDTPQTAAWGSRNRDQSFHRILEKAGYSSEHTAEIAEAIKVIGGAMAGPKAVTVEGQSTHLKVVEVEFKR